MPANKTFLPMKLGKIIPFTDVTVLQRSGHMDVITFNTDIVSTCWVAEGKPFANAIMRCEAAKGTGVDWVRETFGVDPRVIVGY